MKECRCVKSINQLIKLYGNELIWPTMAASLLNVSVSRLKMLHEHPRIPLEEDFQNRSGRKMYLISNIVDYARIRRKDLLSQTRNLKNVIAVTDKEIVEIFNDLIRHGEARFYMRAEYTPKAKKNAHQKTK